MSFATQLIVNFTADNSLTGASVSAAKLPSRTLPPPEESRRDAPADPYDRYELTENSRNGECPFRWSMNRRTRGAQERLVSRFDVAGAVQCRRMTPRKVCRRK